MSAETKIWVGAMLLSAAIGVATIAFVGNLAAKKTACIEACAPALGEWRGGQAGCYCDARWQRPADDGGER